jgi:hypothetical protein
MTLCCRYGDEVENYLDVFLRTPNLPTTDITRALLARANARKSHGEKLLEKAQQGTFSAPWVFNSLSNSLYRLSGYLES